MTIIIVFIITCIILCCIYISVISSENKRILDLEEQRLMLDRQQFLMTLVKHSKTPGKVHCTAVLNDIVSSKWTTVDIDQSVYKEFADDEGIVYAIQTLDDRKSGDLAIIPKQMWIKIYGEPPVRTK